MGEQELLPFDGVGRAVFRGRLDEQCFDQVAQAIVGAGGRIANIGVHGKPVLLYDLKSAGAQAYVTLVREILRRERGLAA